MLINYDVDVTDLQDQLKTLFELSAAKILDLQESWDPAKGTPVFTEKGTYASRGWTEWTQGFQFGSAILQFDATGDEQFLEIGRGNTLKHMASHVTHSGVHDHGFNNVSTYGNLHRLMREGVLPENAWERAFYEMALKASGAVQAGRWTDLGNGEGYIYSFNGPHSLFADTIRSLRVLALAHQFGHVLMAERDRPVSLLERLIVHADTTSRYNVYFGKERDMFDVRGRVAHESVFNVKDGSYRCPSSQQGYSPFTTWTRGLAWIILGFAEQLEFLKALTEDALKPFGGKDPITKRFEETAEATADYYIEQTPTDGVPYWDTGAPGLVNLEHYVDMPADPFNAYEPVDSSAAAIAAQGFLRLGGYFNALGRFKPGRRYLQAGLTIAKTLFAEPYLSMDEDHQGLILHSVYHRPNGWDHIPDGQKVPCGESSMWGDYHARELALIMLRMAEKKPYYAFFVKPAAE